MRPIRSKCIIRVIRLNRKKYDIRVEHSLIIMVGEDLKEKVESLRGVGANEGGS